MIRYKGNMVPEKREHMRGGDGIATVTPAFVSGDYQSDLRLYAHITLPVGASIGYHVHQGEEEFFYLLAGTAEFNDNGTVHTITSGDATVTCSGEGHSIRNISDTPVEILAVIAKTNG